MEINLRYLEMGLGKLSKQLYKKYLLDISLNFLILKNFIMKLNISYLWWIENKDKGYSLTGSSTLFELIDENGEKIQVFIK